jgi:hypothetical protein
MEMKMSKSEWSTIQKIPEWVVITPAKDPDMNDEWVLRREAEKRIEKLEAEKAELESRSNANWNLAVNLKAKLDRVMGALGNWRFVEDKLARQFWEEIISALGDEE